MDNKEYIVRAKETIKKNLSKDDLIRRMVNLIDESEAAENVLFEATFDMFFLYYPEAAVMLKERDKFVSSLKSGVSRDEVSQKMLISAQSFGYDLDANGMSLLSDSVARLRELDAFRIDIAGRLDNIVKVTYKNLYSICGGMLSARLLCEAKGLKNLAFMPSSKVQILGSTVIFSGRKADRSPKYGLLFKHSLIQDSPQNIRGRVARALASKASMAARVDLFSGTDNSTELDKKLEEEIKKIRGYAIRKSGR
jgi:nucleolar protein 56